MRQHGNLIVANQVEITGYERYQDGHGLEVRWPLPARCRCEKCSHDDVAHIEFKTTPQAIRDLNLWEQPYILDLPSSLPPLCAV